MAVRNRMGRLDPIENQELILKGDQKSVLTVMLSKEAFALLKLPHERSESAAEIAVLSISGYSNVCAIRNLDFNTPYANCDYYLCINNREGDGRENLQDALKCTRLIMEYRKVDIELNISFPTADEFLLFMEDKELVFDRYYRSCGGDTEGLYRSFFMDNFLKMRALKTRNLLVFDAFYDIRIFVTKIGNDPSLSVNELTPDDVRNFDIDSILHDYLREKTTGYYCNSSFDYNFDFEAQSDMAKASYFFKLFHGIHEYNHERYHDPEGRLCYRFSVFVLPGIVSNDNAGVISKDKRAFNFVDGTEYKIDSIHINTEICSDISEFKDWIDYDLDAMVED